MSEKHKVLIMRCDKYDSEKIAGIVKEGMEELGVRPTGNVLLKPNAVLAHPEVFPHAFTRPEFIDGVISATKERAEDAKEIAIGERSGITIPTRFNFKMAGYNKVIKKHKIKAHYFDETKQVPFELKKKEKETEKNLKSTKKSVENKNLPKLKPELKLELELKPELKLKSEPKSVTLI